MTNKDKKGFAKWLEKLQQESWQLELIISGFAIFLLIGVYEPIHASYYELKKISYLDTQTIYYYFANVITLMHVVWYVLVVNLIVHVFLRGLWISTIGLRYVSGDIDYESLNFNKKFNQFLRKQVGSFDDYIERLEKICSIIFGFTFLVLFIALSILLGIFFIASISVVFGYLNFNSALTNITQLTLIFLGLVYLVDFITLGWLKKQDKIAKIYYPIYRFFSFITLSFLYRPLYYNLIDNKFGRWVGLLIIPYLFVFAAISLLKIDSYSYLPSYKAQQTLNTDYYDDKRGPKRTKLGSSIPSKYIKNGFVELFIPYIPNQHNSSLAELCPNLKPGPSGLTFDIYFGENDNPKLKLNADSTLACFSSLHQIFINDSLKSDVSYRFYNHPQRKQEGLVTILDVGKLPRGEHQISIKSKTRYERNKNDSLVFKQQEVIPFWKE